MWYLSLDKAQADPTPPCVFRLGMLRLSCNEYVFFVENDMLKFLWLFLFILCGCTSSQGGASTTHAKEGTIDYLVYDNSDNLISSDQITHLLIGTPQTIKVKFTNQKRSVKLNAVMKQITDGKEINANINLISLNFLGRSTKEYIRVSNRNV